MKRNGLNVNPTYSNGMACAQFIAVIGGTLKQKTAADVGNATQAYMSFMIDGNTDVSTKECDLLQPHFAQRETGQHL